MTLYTSDYLEYYLTLVGWIIYDNIWGLFEETGLFALPVLIIVIQEWLRARAEGADEGNKGVLSAHRIENRIWVAIVLIMFAGIPVIPTDLATIKFDTSRSQQCNVNVPQPNDTQWSTAFTTLNNQSALVPVWWFFLHSLSHGVTGAAVAAIPCGADLRQMRMDIDNTRIANPLLAQEVADFTRDCYGPARAKLFMTRPSLTDDQMNDVTWIGSNFFSGTSGYYDTHHSSAPRSSWPYSATRDAGLAQVDNGGGYPTCKQWWSDASVGLRDRLLGQVDSGLLTRLSNWAGFLSKAQVDDSVIRAVASPRQQTMNQGAVYTDYGGQVDMTLPNEAARAAGNLGLTAGSLGYFPAMDVVRRALPMVLSYLKMALVISIGFVLIFGTYALSVFSTISSVMFALYFVDFWFQLARWVDSTILDALYGSSSPHSNFDPFMGLTNASGDMLLNYVMGAMFIFLPSFWTAAVAWAGIKVGGALQGLTEGSKGAQQAGSKGANMAIGAATHTATTSGPSHQSGGQGRP
jgi:TraG-like protein, N-terminal region